MANHITASIDVIEGWSIEDTPALCGAEPNDSIKMRSVIQGHDGVMRFDEELLSKHTMFLGSIGSGKTTGMMQLLRGLRRSANENDVFVIFDTKGDFRRDFQVDGDAVIANEKPLGHGAVVWSLLADVGGDDPEQQGEDIFEVASTIFASQIDSAAGNAYFALAARDVFASVVEAKAIEGGDVRPTNSVLRSTLEMSANELWTLLGAHGHLAGTKRYLAGDGGDGSRAILAFMQQQVRAVFSGVFGKPGDFSIREFVRAKGGHALFIEYDIASGSLLLPIYRVLLDIAIKAALERRSEIGNVFFVMDEFALLPQLTHLANGINFGRGMGLRFILGAQNASQVYGAYGREGGTSILSGMGSVFAFRLMDAESRTLIRSRFGINKKRIAVHSPVAVQTVQTSVVDGNVIEDWDLSDLGVGECLVCLPTGRPFRFRFKEFRPNVD